MSVFGGKVTVDDREAMRAVEGLALVLAPTALEEFLVGDVETYLHDQVTERFKAQGDDRSGTWKPLAPYTVKERERLGYPGSAPINMRSGDLHDFVAESHGTTEITGDGVSLMLPGEGTAEDEEKLAAAQLGLNPNPINWFAAVPARPVIAVNEADLLFVTEALGERIATQLEAYVHGG